MKKLLIISLVMTSFGLMAQDKSYSMEEVAKHNTPASCWIVLEKAVYDVTGMMDKHNPVLQKQCGKDATEGFKTKAGSGGKHSEKAMAIRDKMKIGMLK